MGAVGSADAGYWRKRVWRLSAPIILSNLFVPLPGAVDTAVLGHTGVESYLGAVAVSNVIFSFIYWGFGFLRMGTTGPAAQAWGAENFTELWAVLLRGGLLAAGFALVLLTAQHLIALIAFPLLDASAEVERHAQTYFFIRIFGAPAALANYVLIGWFLGLQNARVPMVLQIAVNGLNVLLDLVFVLGLGLTVDGVAAATVVAEYSGLALGLYMVFRRRGLWPSGGVTAARIFDRVRLRRMVAINRDIFIRTLCLVFAFAYFTAQGARLGDTILAANMVLMNFMQFAAFGLDGFAHASEALVGDAAGRRDRQAVRLAVRAALCLGGLMAVGLSLTYAVFGWPVILLFTSIGSVQDAAWSYLPWAAALPVLAVWCYVLDGVFLGATRTNDLRNAMILSVLGYVGLLEVAVYLWDAHGLWFALSAFMLLRGVTLWRKYPGLIAATAPASVPA